MQSQMDQDSPGVNTDIFKAHSVRSTATSAAANAEIIISDILKATDWSSESVFHLITWVLELYLNIRNYCCSCQRQCSAHTLYYVVDKH